MIDKYITFLLLMLLYGLYDRFKGIEKRKGIVIGYKYLPCFKVRLDTQKYQHIIITGITGVGKTKLAEYIVKFTPFNQIKVNIEIKNTLYGIKLQILTV